jgi:hypothetical protein
VDLFLSMLTPAQRDAAKAGLNPLDSVAVHRFESALRAGSSVQLAALAGNSGRGSSASSDTYTRELAGGSLFKTLAGEGYNPAQIASAINYARDLGTSDEMARKFIKLDQTSRDDLHSFVDSIRSDPTLSEEQKAAKVSEFREQHPKIGKTLTDQDVLKTIRGDDKKRIKAENVQSYTHDRTQNDSVELNRNAGVEKKVEANHRADVVSVERKPDEVKSELDVFAAIAAKARSREVAEVKPDASGKPGEKREGEIKPRVPGAAAEEARLAPASARSPSLG